jgi:recombination DNA repair RAD52 pathway protein
MKLQVTQENLHRALSAVSRVASNRNSLPILANILLKTVDNRLVIAGTNLDIAITETIGAKVTEEGSLTIPARKAFGETEESRVRNDCRRTQRSHAHARRSEFASLAEDGGKEQGQDPRRSGKDFGNRRNYLCVDYHRG